MAFIPKIIELFGAAINSPEVEAFLTTLPVHRIQEQSDGCQYVVSKEGGFDLLFKETPDAPRRLPQYRVLVAAFLYSKGADKHQAFFDVLPSGFSFEESRQDLLAKRLPEMSWVIGRGRVPASHPDPDSDAWQMTGFNLHASYDDNRRVHTFQVLPPREFTAEMAPPTWQELALMPGQRLAAIKLCQVEHKTNVGQAKVMVEQYLADNAAI